MDKATTANTNFSFLVFHRSHQNERKWFFCEVIIHFFAQTGIRESKHYVQDIKETIFKLVKKDNAYLNRLTILSYSEPKQTACHDVWRLSEKMEYIMVVWFFCCWWIFSFSSKEDAITWSGIEQGPITTSVLFFLPDSLELINKCKEGGILLVLLDKCKEGGIT